ncbi:MAG: AgmX/PglI C-terminal domain-containing protein [Myxococcota bacterium]|jgi:hypothetical protein|nr:AgmX/PglI C-terminal domain-containing protein [Myxococcota bacterium]
MNRLRVGVFHQNRLLEERLVDKPEKLTIGQALSNTLVIPTSVMPRSHQLFERRQNKLFLRVLDSMGGRVADGPGRVMDLSRHQAVERFDQGYLLEISQQGRGKLSLGETRLLFQFVSPASSARVPIAMGGGFLASLTSFVSVAWMLSLLLSAAFQLAPLAFVLLQDWPQTDGFDELPDWYLKDAVQVAEEKEPPPEEEPLPEELIAEGSSAQQESVAELPVAAPKPAERVPERVVRSAGEKALSKKRGTQIAIGVIGIEGDGELGAMLASEIIGSGSVVSSLANLDPGDFAVGNPQGSGLGLIDNSAGSAAPEIRAAAPREELILETAETKAPETKPKKLAFKMSEETKLPSSVQEGDKKGLEAVFAKNKRQIENCYKRVMQQHGPQPGKLVANVTIGTDGTVLAVKVTANEIHASMANCVQDKVKQWSFPKLKKPVSVAKRWVFN